MIEVAIFEWFAETDEGCTWFRRVLPDGEPTVNVVLGGSCEVEALARGEDALWLVRNRSVERISASGVEDLTPPEGWVRHVALTADGAPLVFTVDLDPADRTAPLWTRTWALADGTWVERESTREDVDTVRAVAGGPVWQARQPGASVDRWTAERAPGFALHMPDDAPLPKRLRPEGTLMWGVLPAGERQLAVRYTMLGVPLPAGPVFLGRGKRWRLLDDSRFLETPACAQVATGWLLLSYEGWNPVLVDLASGRTLTSGEESAGWSGAWLVGAQ